MVAELSQKGALSSICYDWQSPVTLLASHNKLKKTKAQTMPIYSNQKAKTAIRTIFQKKANAVSTIRVASAFFNYYEVVQKLNERGTKLDLIVRLSEATSATALSKIHSLPNVQVRFYTSEKFHPKLYIFGNHSAIVGSANFTESGFNSNNEICVEVGGETEEFDELASLFQKYWDEAQVLTPDAIRKYLSIHEAIPANNTRYNAEADIQKIFGNHAPTTEIRSSAKRKEKKILFIEDYERSYQTFSKAFRVVEEIYRRTGKRKLPEEKLPLRIEIDQFFNFIRTTLTKGDSYNEEPIRTGAELERHTVETLQKWFATDWPYLEHVTLNYTKINEIFSSDAKILTLSVSEIFDALDVCHAFHEQLRYHSGGHVNFRKKFESESNPEHLRETIAYLLFGTGNYVTRMANCIFGEYKVDFLSRYSIQELFGWVNSEDVPICNTRTLKSLRYLGALASDIPTTSRTHDE